MAKGKAYEGDRGSHFVIYLMAGAAMGGFLDVVAFQQPTPVEGMIAGAVIAVLYQAVLWMLARRDGDG